MKKKIVVFTGAGISAESGIRTFRDNDGLWNEYPVAEVATKFALEHNTEIVLKFYNQRRLAAAKAQPNFAHIALAELESTYEVIILTQNVDDLHERAGSSNVIHLHGQLNRAQSSIDSSIVYAWDKPIHIGQHCELNSQLRPNIVLFGEPVLHLEEARRHIKSADKVLAIGSSLTVLPAASLLKKAPYKAEKILVSLDVKGKIPYGYKFLRGKAANIVPAICKNWIL
ncbi:SIR2 family NAD-dependent protein deacylase [Vibrio porteresiae]|uniref:protein acetyllysine N-acetyltransferase n=1 Tax=Vibrio porteresiae DSM 19223 TaxID=1123496 RepID=A0ABZ0QJU4_9VIBR|nr:Sir2 family NAD-dependent protein deacetylase [Vibrio porteresiae]WPC76778.1 Sir2 family NAD-dependent protein deacetylase [Vibrio porteresiae DSM 19223]